MDKKDVFIRDLDKIEKDIQKVLLHTKKAREYYKGGVYQVAYEESFEIENLFEKMTLCAREMPVLIGGEQAIDEVEETVKTAVKARAEFTDEGWFHLTIPTLLPRKEKGSVDYIRGIIYPTMREFFSDKAYRFFGHNVLIYKHVYDRNRPERQWRDHDNIETNIVTDIITLYLLPDDNPNILSHFECSMGGATDKTEVFLVPESELEIWLKNEIKRL